MRNVRDTCNKIALEFSESTYKLLNAGMMKSLLASAWSRSAGSLHLLENFGRISVAKPGGRTVEEIQPDLPCKVKVSFDWNALGLDPAKVKITAPKLENFQEAQVFGPGTTEFSFPKDKGIILLLEKR